MWFKQTNFEMVNIDGMYGNKQVSPSVYPKGPSIWTSTLALANRQMKSCCQKHPQLQSVSLALIKQLLTNFWQWDSQRIDASER